LLRGPLVLEKVLAKPEIAQQPEVRGQASPLEWLQRNVVARNVGGSDLFELSFAGPQPANAAKIVNTIVGCYLEVSSQKSEEQTRRVVELLTAQRESRAKEVERLRETVRTLAKQITGKDPYLASSRETQPHFSALAALQERLANTEVERQVLEARQTALTEALSGTPPEIPAETADQMLEARPEIIRFKQDMEFNRARLEESQRVGQPGNQWVSKLAAQIETDEQRLKELRAKVKISMLSEFSINEAKRRRELLAEQSEQVANLQLTERLLRERVEKLTKGQVETGGSVVELDFAKGELLRAESVFDRIADRILALTTETNAPERVTQLRPATEPTEPEVKSPSKMIMLASLAAFAFPFVLVIAWERHVRRILDPEQIQDEAQLRVVGEIATLPVRRFSAGFNGGRTPSWTRTVFEESIDCLRTSIVLSEGGKDVQVIAVVSAVSQEGKTSLSAQLAISLARATGKSVLLIDGDMRSPDLHEVFGVPKEPGLVKTLAKTCAPGDAVKRSPSNPLVDLMPAGRLTKNPHTLLGNGAFSTLIDQLRAEYGYIVIDTPPVLSASESLTLARAADGVLICTLREASRAAQVRLTHERLAAAGCRVMGVVLSGVPTRSYAYKYGSYGYSNA
jgi:capsular exopolysaccharide synthesis family protein